MSRLMKRQAAADDYSALVDVISELSISDLRSLITEINDAERGGWNHIIPYDIEEIDDMMDNTNLGVYALLKQFDEWEFDVNDEYFFWDDERPLSVPDEGGVREWIEENTNDYEELAEDVMNMLGSKSFRDNIPVAVKNAAMELEEEQEADEDE